MNTNCAISLRDLKCGGVVQLLSILSGEREETIENMLRKGITPWELAKDYCILDEFRDTLLERIISDLSDMVHSGQISQQDADDFVACFEIYAPADQSLHK